MPVPPAAAADTGWWRAVSEACKNRISPMYRAFLDLCTGVPEGDLVNIYVPDDMTRDRLDNDRVRGVLAEEAERAAGGPIRIKFTIGEPPRGSAQENLAELLKFGGQFDNIKIR